MAMYAMFLFMLYLWTVKRINSSFISGTVTDDTSFIYKEFPTPSQSATVECIFSYTFNTISDYVIFHIYTTKEHLDFDQNCSKRQYGQLRNRDLHYNYGFRRARDECRRKGGRLTCRVSTKIQDYKSRNFGFSFQFFCGDKARKSLKSLIYNVTISAQTNETICSPMPDISPNCSKYYTQVSHPNLLEHQTKGGATWSFSYIFLISETSCYQHFVEASCYLFFPRCNSTSNSIIVPCRETAKEFLIGCFDSFTHGQYNTFDVDVEYLPSKDGSTDCFYRPVFCQDPPKKIDLVVEDEFSETRTYSGGTAIKYACADKSMKISGNDYVTCSYSGEWSNPPVCVPKPPLLKILLPIFAALLFPSLYLLLLSTENAKRGYQDLMP